MNHLIKVVFSICLFFSGLLLTMFSELKRREAKKENKSENLYFILAIIGFVIFISSCFLLIYLLLTNRSVPIRPRVVPRVEESSPANSEMEQV